VLFNSFDFGFFLVIVYLAYWTIGTQRRKAQNVLLLAASYLFYGLWDWRFLSLLVLSSLVDYLVGHAIEASSSRQKSKMLLTVSVLWNLGVLITFKYFNFFLDSFNTLFEMEASESNTLIWGVLVPVGLSFYTFQTLSYSIDVYKGRTKATNSLLSFLCFVSFFPQLVAGPIERAKQLLPQFKIQRTFNIQTSKEGLRQILWGLFKKILVADKLGIAVSMVFNEPEAYGSLTLIYVAILFCFQIYCDFSGYTDIAIGTAKLFGFKLSKNFNLPYLARSITEFWKRWHITLTQWFTDYVYIPFVKGTKHVNIWTKTIGLLITMLLVGLWHGANWTFVAFGLWHGLFLIVERIPLGKSNNTLVKRLQKLPRVLSLIYLFVICGISAILFRSENMDQALYIFQRIFSLTPDENLTTLIGSKLWYLVAMLLLEVITRRWDFPLQKIQLRVPIAIRWAIYYVAIILLIRYAEVQEAFIYFQF